jgi:hypothetical protein
MLFSEDIKTLPAQIEHIILKTPRAMRFLGVFLLYLYIYSIGE